MKRLWVHSEQIKRQGEKIQFQIKLPSNARRLLSLMVSCSFGNSLIGSNKQKLSVIAPAENVGDFPPAVPLAFQKDAGYLWLRLSEKRDVYYTQIVKQNMPSHKQGLNLVPELGIGQGEYWINGKNESFFDVSADLNPRIIEGFYVDRSKAKEVDYTLKIYLKLAA